MPAAPEEEPGRDLVEPLLLLGTCNNWDLAVADRQHAFKAILMCGGRAESRLRLELPPRQQPVSFQVVSTRRKWAWRLYPADVAHSELLLESPEAQVAALLAAGDESHKAHGRNFRIRASTPLAEVVDIIVSLGPGQQISLRCLPAAGGDAAAATAAARAPQTQPLPSPGLPSPAVPTRRPDGGSVVAPSAAPLSLRPASKREEARAATPLPRPAAAALAELEPFRLVGEFCDWQLEVDCLSLQKCGPPRRDWYEYRLCFVLQVPKLEFQVVSASVGFRWRLFPGGGGGSLAEGSICQDVLAGGEADGHGANFCIQEAVGRRLALVVRLHAPAAAGAGGGAGPPVAAELLYEYLSVESSLQAKVAISKGSVAAYDEESGEARAWRSDPGAVALGELGAFRLVGKPCRWRLEQSGLELEAQDTRSDWAQHRLCFRLLTRHVDFQVVSGRLGFRWRLFPPDACCLVPRTERPEDGVEAVLGGKEDGHGRNFRVLGDPLSAVTIFVWLEGSAVGADGRTTLRRARLGMLAKDTGVKVGIGATRVHYPPRPITPLGPELLELAESEEERARVLEMRHELIRRLAWQMQEEYRSEDVQREVLALRKLYPYRQEKALLAIGIEEREQMAIGGVASSTSPGPAALPPPPPAAAAAAPQQAPEAALTAFLSEPPAARPEPSGFSDADGRILEDRGDLAPGAPAPAGGSSLRQARSASPRPPLPSGAATPEPGPSALAEVRAKAETQNGCFDFDALEAALEEQEASGLQERAVRSCGAGEGEGENAAPVSPTRSTAASADSLPPMTADQGDWLSCGASTTTAGAEPPALLASSPPAAVSAGQPDAPEVSAAEGAAGPRLSRPHLLGIMRAVHDLLSKAEIRDRMEKVRRSCAGRIQFDRVKMSMLPEASSALAREGSSLQEVLDAAQERLLNVPEDAELQELWLAVEAQLSFGTLGPWELARGDCVEIAGLEATAGGQALNGQLGVISGYDPAPGGGYEVSLETGAAATLPPHRLRRLSDEERFAACQVRLLALAATPPVRSRLLRLREAAATSEDYAQLLPKWLWRPLLEPAVQKLGADRQWYSEMAASTALPFAAAEGHRQLEGLLTFGPCRGQRDPPLWGAFETQVLGRWAYGSRGAEYVLSHSPDARLHFDGPHSGAGRVVGDLQPIGTWMEGVLTSAQGEKVGRIRLRYSRADSTMVSNYMSASRSDWGKDIVARRPAALGAEGKAGLRMLTSSDAPAAAAAGASSAAQGVSRTEEEDQKWRCLLGLSVIQQQVQDAAAQDQEGAGEPDGQAGARKAHLEHMRLQQRVLERMLRNGSDEGVSYKHRLFGNTEDQFISVVQSLPSVKAARARAMGQMGVPEETSMTALRACEARHWEDRAVHEANVLTLVRLRVLACPHPDTLDKVAGALQERGYFAGTPDDWFFGLDTTVHSDWEQSRQEVQRCWQRGAFKHWFGGPRAGRYMVTSAEELWDQKCVSLHDAAVLVRDELGLILERMGDAGKRLRVEPRVLLAYHAEGQALPPWEDAAGRRTRRLTLTFQLSIGHARAADGGALRLHRTAAGTRGQGQRGGVVAEVPAGGGNWCVFRTHEFKQEVAKVRQPCGRWCITVCAEEAQQAAKPPEEPGGACGAAAARVARPAGLREEEADNFAAQEVHCDVCGFAAGDGIRLPCKSRHQICRECLQREIRSAVVPTCPACAGEDDRVYVAGKFDLFMSTGLDDIGCVCPDDVVDVGARVVIFGQCKASQLNGKLAELIWWDEGRRCWEARVFATGALTSVTESCCQLAECCQAGGELSRCPCWPGGRGLYPISLGNRCCVKLGLDELTGGIDCATGYPHLHGQEYMPFDSILTSLDALLFFLRHNFTHFFHYNNCLDVTPKHCPHVVFHNYRSSLHSFPHHHPQKDSNKLWRRVERFRVLCRHSRDARGARAPLFVRYAGSSDELGRIEELWSLLRLWAGPRARLLVVSMLQPTPGQKPQVLRHAAHPRILLYLVPGMITVMDFGPIKQAIRLAVHDEAGLLQCDTVTSDELIRRAAAFTDPYTTKSTECVETWLTPLDGKDAAFFPDCPLAQQVGQGRHVNEVLRAAARQGDMEAVREALGSGEADANSWDQLGRTPLHDVCELAGRSISVFTAVRIAGALLLAHGDPRCADRSGAAVLEVARRAPRSARDRGCPAELCALMEAAAFVPCRDPGALYAALEMLGEPFRSQLARILGVDGLRAVGEAELCWRNPPPDSESVIAHLEEELKSMEQLPEVQRKKALKRLLLEWHPDKNAHRPSLATTIFQFLQAHKGKVIGR